jgi:5'-nucleotidase (lipoprotein e(P4) family)
MNKKLIFLILIISSCSAPRPATTTNISNDTEKGIVTNGKLFTALFQQQAAEYKALCFQAYNIARLRVSLVSQVETSGKKLAIVTDVDETVLDNSPVAVKEGLKGQDYNQNAWYEWTSKSMADTVPGAPSFLKYASSKGIEIFYITNRDEKERAATLTNLQKYNLPNADNDHILLKQNTSGKEARRQQVLAQHDIILLIGDNLSDFNMLFDKKSIAERNEGVTNLSSEFGNRFIVLPNPNYGDWENSVYKYNYNLSEKQKDSVIKSILKSF